MERLARIGEFLRNAGFTVGAIAWLYAAFGPDRASGMVAFVLAFIAAVVGFVLIALFGEYPRPFKFNTFLAERVGIEPSSYESSPLGRRVAAIGFAILCIPTAIGGFFLGKTDDELAPFWWTGCAVLLVGVLIMIFRDFDHRVHRR